MVNPLTISYRYTYKVVEFRQIAYQASRGVLEPLHHRLNPSVHLHTPLLVSLRTRPSKNRKEGLVNWLGWKCTLCLVCRCTSDWLLISILMCIYWKC